jgi:indole-3-glycerol phosphate synthase
VGAEDLPKKSLAEQKPKRKRDMPSIVENVPDVLAEILAAKREEVRALSPERVRAGLRDASPVRPFADALRRDGEVTLLAEVKPRSPSAGAIREGSDPVQIAMSYERGGAAALSVLTDQRFFGGSLEALRAVRQAVSLPVLRKDFVIDRLQVEEARAAGADAVLLIVAALDDASLRDLHGRVRDLGMDALVEVHDEREMERALEAGADIIGVNNRDLRSFRTDLAVTERLAPAVPGDAVLVGESGVRSRTDVARLGAAGADAVLVGESLMRQADVEAAARALVGAPRRRR